MKGYQLRVSHSPAQNRLKDAAYGVIDLTGDKELAIILDDIDVLRASNERHMKIEGSRLQLELERFE